MTRNDSPRRSSDRSATNTSETTTGSGHPTRRDFVRAAGAGAGALALGGTVPSGAAAQQGDGPGQDISTPRLETDGNLVVDPDGNTITLRGLNIADPRRLDASAPMRGKNAIQTIDYLTDSDLGWHPRVLRLPIHPGDIGDKTPVPEYNGVVHDPVAFTQDQLEYYCKNHLDPAVDRCKERGVYAIIDFHRHWGPTQWTIPELDEEVRMFWDYVAERYGDREHCIFEVYNEPKEPQVAGQFVDENGDVHEDWLLWRDTCGEWVDIIRDHTDNLVIVGSPNYSQRPEGGVVAPFPQDNLGYTYHIYPQHNVSKANAWDEPDGANESAVAPDGTGVWEEAPLFVTEFGWEDPDLDTFYLVQGTEEGFGNPFLDFLESHPAIHFTAWCADPIWRSVMFTRGFLDEDPFDPVDTDSVPVNPYEEEVPQRCENTPCDWELLTQEHGEFMGGVIKDHLAEYKDDNVPPKRDERPSVPSSPSSVSVEETTESTLLVEWSSVSNADEYHVSVDDEDYDTTSDTSMLITGLSPGTSYDIEVTASNDAGTSPSTEVSGTTDSDAGDTACELEGYDTETLADGSTVCDVDGDGHYRDVNGDAAVSNGDITDFFSNQHVDPWDSRTDLFDFDGNEDVGQGDVVELFHYVN